MEGIRKCGAHLLLQIRTRALDGTLRPLFERWYPGLPATTPSSPCVLRRETPHFLMLSINAEYGRVLRRVQVKADRLGGLGFKVQVVGRQIPFQPKRLEAVLGPDPRDRHGRDITTQFGGELARRPRRRAVRQLVFGGPRQHPGRDPIGHLVTLTPDVAGQQPRLTIRCKSLAPAVDVAIATIELRADRGPRESLRQQQNQPRVARRICPAVPRTGLTLKFHALSFGQFHRALRRHDCASYLNVTVH